MAELEISDDLKMGIQEILVDPTKTANKCGSIVTALLGNHLSYKRPDGTYINLIDFIMQDKISIADVVVAVTENTMTITWIGDNSVQLNLNDDVPLVYTDETQNSHTFTALANGTHTITIRATRDLRGITEVFVIAVADGSSEDVTITYGGA